MKITTDDIEELENKGQQLLDKGYEIVKPIYVSFFGKYAIKFSNNPNSNSVYLQTKRLQKEINNSWMIWENKYRKRGKK